MFDFGKRPKRDEGEKQPSNMPNIVNSILGSPVMMTVAVISGCCFMVSTVIESGFLGSIEMSATETGIQLKIDSGQLSPKSTQPNQEI